MSTNVLADKDVNAAMATQDGPTEGKPDVKNLEYHRQVLQSKIAQEKYAVL